MGLTFERLEDRLLLAGFVDVVLKGRTLVVTGDILDNEIEFIVIPVGNLDLLSVVGKNGTTVLFEDPNNAVFSAEQITKVKVSMKGGNDKVDFNPVDFLVNSIALCMDTGTGDDEIHINPTADMNEGMKFTAKMGKGNDFISFNSENYQLYFQNANINMGGGDDLFSSNSGNALFGGKTKFNGGGGKNDQFFFDDFDPNNQPLDAKFSLKGFESGDVDIFSPTSTDAPPLARFLESRR